ncbi:MAG: response regulator [Promethearchaeota archaeon]
MKKKKNPKNDKKFVGILVDNETKKKWENFADNYDYTTVSKLIREAVNFYIDSQYIISYIKDFSNFTHNLKEPLTSIKGFSQIILEKYSNKLDINLLLRIKEIIKQTEFLENTINQISFEFAKEIEEFDVLIIEDDIPTTMVLTDLFELKDKTCKVAINGMKGLELLKKSKPKLILLDIVLPDINGYEICKKIKFDQDFKKFKDIPIYFITALEESKVKENMNETQANGFFLKPFVLSEFELLFNYLEHG